MNAFFRPAGIAVVGASRSPDKIGHHIVANLLAGHFRGTLQLVHPTESAILGVPAFPSLAAAPGPVELAVLALPAERLNTFLADLDQRMAARGDVKALVAITAGFADAGTAPGQARQRALVAACRRHGIRLLGPNCIGVADTHSGVDTTFISPLGRVPGEVSLISQSGAMAAWLQGIWADHPAPPGLAKLISTGNTADVGLEESLAYLTGDPDTRVIGLYLEGTDRARPLLVGIARAAAVKPVVVLKVARTEHGRQAAATHTGALAGDDRLWDSALRQAGAVRAGTPEEFSDLLMAFSRLWPQLSAPGPRRMIAPLRVALVTNAGGPGIFTADAVIDEPELTFASFSRHTRRSLAQALPPWAAVGKPDGHVDATAGATPAQMAKAAALLASDRTVDTVIYMPLHTPMVPQETLATTLLAELAAARDSRAVRRPVAAVLPCGRQQEAPQRLLAAAGMPVFTAPQRAARALGALAAHAAWMQRHSGPRPWMEVTG